MNERYSWRNYAALDRFSTDPHGGHQLDSPTGYRWHCTACGMTREGVHRIDFYTLRCHVPTPATTPNTQGCSPSKQGTERGPIDRSTRHQEQ